MTTLDDLTEVQKKKLAQVQDILRLAEDESATPAEAALASERAAEILARYNIDAALAMARADVRAIPVDKVIHFPQPYAKQHASLFFNILKIFGGDAVIISRPRRNSRRKVDGIQMHVYAYEADLMAVDVMYTSLMLQAVQQLSVAEIPPWDSARSYRVGWWLGFTNEVAERLTAAMSKATESTAEAGSAIVLRERSLAVKEAMNDRYPKTHKIAGSSTRSEDGFNMGSWAGRTANIHDKQATGTSATRGALG